MNYLKTAKTIKPLCTLTTLSLLLLLQSCNHFHGHTYLLYCIDTSQTSGSLFKEIKCYLPYTPENIEIKTLLQTLLDFQDDPLLPNYFPSNLSLHSAHLSPTGILELEFSAEYGELSGIRRTVTDYAITLTLTQLPDVVALHIYVFGEDPTLSPNLLRPSDLLPMDHN